MGSSFKKTKYLPKVLFACIVSFLILFLQTGCVSSSTQKSIASQESSEFKDNSDWSEPERQEREEEALRREEEQSRQRLEAQEKARELARLQKQDEEEALKRKAEKEQARRQALEEERRRKEAEEKLRLQAQERLRREEEERARQRKEEELRIAERKHRENMFAARKAREEYLQQQFIYEKQLQVYLEEKRRKEREERLARLDPDGIYFFRRDMNRMMPATVHLTVPEKYKLLLFMIPSPVVMQGYPGWTNRLVPVRGSGEEVNSQEEFLQKIYSKQGTVAVVLESLENPGKRILPLIQVNGQKYYLTSWYSDGFDFIRVTAETSIINGRTGSYAVWAPEKLILDFK